MRTPHAITLSLALGAALITPAAAVPSPGPNEVASRALEGGTAEGESRRPAVSAEGRFVVFESSAPDLVPGDTNERFDVFLLDRGTGAIERISEAPGGQETDGDSYAAFMTPDAATIGFISEASNLVPNDVSRCTNAFGQNVSCPDVILFDREAGTFERASVSSEEAEANDASFNGVAITPNGRYVAYWSDATNLAEGDTNNRGDIYLRDRVLGTTTRVSVGDGRTQGDGNSSEPALSADGRFVAFKSYAGNLSGLDTNSISFSDIYVHDILTGQTERVSVSSDGDEGNANSSEPVISADGRYVAFESEANNLVAGDTNAHASDIYLHDRLTGRTSRVSVRSDGVEAAGRSYDVSMTPDARTLVFNSEAANLAPNDTQACFVSVVQGNASCRDVFLHDRLTGQTDRLSVPLPGLQNDGHAGETAISDDGRVTAWASGATTLVPQDDNDLADVFARDRGPATGAGDLAASAGDGSIQVSGWTRFEGSAISDSDAPADAGPGGEMAGLELIGASAAVRPEEGDLLLRLDLATLPPQPRPGSLSPRLVSPPGVIYGMELTTGGIRYEARTLRAAATAMPPATPSFALYRCAPDCQQTATLTGGIGTTGDQVSIAVPLSALGAPASVQDLRAFTGPGESLPGTVRRVDEVRLPALDTPGAVVSLGIAPAGTAPGEVAFTTTASASGGSFSGTLSTVGLASGAYDVWARACGPAGCGARSIRVDL